MNSSFLVTDYEEAQMSPKNSGLPLPLAHNVTDSKILGKPEGRRYTTALILKLMNKRRVINSGEPKRAK